MQNIDIKSILKSGNYKGLSKLPDFGYNLIAKIVKQDEINSILEKYGDYYGIDFLIKIAEYLNVKIDIQGIENLPENGRCFFTANHAYGIVDGLVITKIVGEKYGELKFIGNEVFNLVPNLRPLTIAVNVLEKSPRENLIALNKAYLSNIPITHFPNGKVSRVYKWKVQDKYWQKGFITKAISGQRDVVPIRFYGSNSNLFHFIYILRNALFIKKSIEFILFPRELFRMKNKTIRVKIGKPIPFSTFDKSMSHAEWAQKVKKIVYEM